MKRRVLHAWSICMGALDWFLRHRSPELFVGRVELAGVLLSVSDKRWSTRYAEALLRDPRATSLKPEVRYRLLARLAIVVGRSDARRALELAGRALDERPDVPEQERLGLEVQRIAWEVKSADPDEEDESRLAESMRLHDRYSALGKADSVDALYLEFLICVFMLKMHREEEFHERSEELRPRLESKPAPMTQEALQHLNWLHSVFFGSQEHA
jgi:hypothetical protein